MGSKRWYEEYIYWRWAPFLKKPVFFITSHLLRLLEHLEQGDVCQHDITASKYRQLIHTALEVGLDHPTLLATLGRTSISFTRLDIASLSSCMWRGLLEEKKWVSAGMDGDGILCLVPKLAFYKELDGKNRLAFATAGKWLLPETGHYQYWDEYTPIVDCQSLAWPLVITQLLKQHPQRLVFAGGALLECVCPYIHRDDPHHLNRTFTLFIVAGSHERATSVLMDALHMLDNHIEHLNIMERSVIVYTSLGVNIQFVLRMYETIAQVVCGADLLCCRVGAWYSKEGDLCLKSAPSWLPCVQSMTLPIDFSTWSKVSVYRYLRYHKKGFDVFVPGTDRRQFKNPDRKDVSGLATLFAAENTILLYRSVAGLALNLPLTEYDIALVTIALGYGLSQPSDFVSPSMDLTKPLMWHTCAYTGKSNYAIFEPADPDIADLYPEEKNSLDYSDSDTHHGLECSQRS